MDIFMMAYNNASQTLAEHLADHPGEKNKLFIERRPRIVRYSANIVWGAKEVVRYGSYTASGLAAVGVATVPPAGLAYLATGCILMSSTGKGIGEVAQKKLSHFSFDRSNWTPLHFAASVGATEAALELINRGADTELRDDSNRSFLDIAKNCGYKDTMGLPPPFANN